MESSPKKAKLSSEASQRLSQVASHGLQNKDALVNIARSASSLKNTKRAGPLLTQFASELGMRDPEVDTPQSLTMILNLIYTYCKTGTPNALSVDSLNALIQGLRNVYSAYGHKGAWRVDQRDSSASGNPLDSNEDLLKPRMSHKVHPSRLGR